MVFENIYILGAGAIGKALAAFLRQQHQPATLVRASTSLSKKQDEQVVVNLNSGEQVIATVPVTSLDLEAQLNGLVVIATKSFGNAALAKQLQHKAQGPLVVLQNGLGIEQPFLEAQLPEVHRCVLLATSQQQADGSVRFKLVSDSPIGVVRGTDALLTRAVDALTTPLFPFKTVADIQPYVWKKAAANSVFNSICPLLEVDNGIFHRNTTALALAERVVRECVAVAHAHGVVLQINEVLESILQISRASDGQWISTLQDIRHGRETEIDTLNLAFARLAQQLLPAVPVTNTQLLGELVQLKATLSRTHQGIR